MSTGHRIVIKRGLALKGGKLRKSTAHMDVCARLKATASKRVRVIKRAEK